MDKIASSQRISERRHCEKSAIEAPETSKPKQIGAGDDNGGAEAEAEAPAEASAAEAAPPTLDAETSEEADGDEVIHEAQLIEEFERLEKDLT